MAKHNDNRLAPTLLVGLGGQGCKIVARVSQLANEEQKKYLSFVAFDTDVNELRTIRRDYPDVRTVQTSSRLTVGEYLYNDENAKNNWFPINNILNRKTPSEGAGQVRAISRLVMDTAIRSGDLEPLHEAIDNLYKLTSEESTQATRIVIISSLAGGIVVLIIKPFGLGDYVEVDGTAGTVQEITLFSTVLTTLDNKRVSIPNNEVAGAKIVNYSAEEKRRVEVTFSIGYGDDYDRARALILRAIDETGLALSEPAPVVRMSGHGASSISIVTRVWVKNADFAEMTFQLYERVKKLFDENGISIPYDQLDVHLTHTGS